MLLLCYKNVTTHKAPFSLIQQQISENVTIVTTFSDIYYKAFSEVLFFLCNICNIVTNVIKKQRIGSAATFVSGYTPVGTIINRPPETGSLPHCVWGKRNISFGKKMKPTAHFDFLTPRKGAFENQADD